MPKCQNVKRTKVMNVFTDYLIFKPNSIIKLLLIITILKMMIMIWVHEGIQISGKYP